MQSSNETLQVHIETQTFSAVSAVSLSDNTFNATYDNYTLIVDFVNSLSADNFLRLRVGGADASDSTYQRQLLSANGTSIAGSRAANQTSFYFGAGNANREFAQLQIIAPFKTTTTQFFLNRSVYSDSTTPDLNILNGAHNNTTSYDSLTFFANTGTLTGSYSIFAYAKA